MSSTGPIIIIEDDPDDQEMMKEIFIELGIPNDLRFFIFCPDVYEYLLVTQEKPFIIISDVNLPVMKGTELKQKINDNEFLRKKSIPFVFLTTGYNQRAIDEAYEMMVQGYFVKPATFPELKELIKMTIDYWKACRHPKGE
jgi:CheY-like chemotaxis protein